MHLNKKARVTRVAGTRREINPGRDSSLIEHMDCIAQKPFAEEVIRGRLLYLSVRQIVQKLETHHLEDEGRLVRLSAGFLGMQRGTLCVDESEVDDPEQIS